MKTDHQRRVEAFMQRAEQFIPLDPAIPDEETRLLRAKLMLEEVLETIQKGLGVNVAVRYTGVGAEGWVPLSHKYVKNGLFSFEISSKAPNLIEIADGCADVSVVTVGTLSACGIDDQPLLEIIDQSNLDKFRGDAHRAPDGKWVKPSDWKAPDILDVLRRQGYRG